MTARVDQIVTGCGGQAGSGAARCPAHDDQHASLSVTEREGKVLVRCHAGCTQAAVIGALKERGLWPEPAEPPASKAKRIVATYDYQDASGELIAQVVRYNPKSFKQRRPDGKGGWVWSVKGVHVPPYRLPVWKDKPGVMVVEGEKDADALHSLGIAATCNPMGAGKWRQHHTEALAEKIVAIIADADEAGRKHAQEVASALYGVAKSVRVLECPDGHKDAADWIAAGATRDEVTRRIKDTPEWAPDTTATPGTWTSGLLLDNRKEPRALLANALHALRRAPELAGAVAFDAFRQRIVIVGGTPWNSPAGALWGDRDDALLAEWLQIHSIRVGAELAGQAVSTVAQDNQRDSLREYLTGLRWDERRRLDRAAAYFGAEPDGLSSRLARLWLISAVARGLQPGCQVDHVLTLEGPQGARKSSGLRALFDPDGAGWFRDELPPLDSKDSALQLVGAWCIEISELDAVNARRAELEKVKAFLSRRVDSYRPPYGRRVVDMPRRCVFAGSTNEGAYLKDSTGNRRWWPLPCGRIDVDAIARDRDQLWAEAVTEYERGEAWWPETEEPEITQLQEERRNADPWEEPVLEYVRVRDVVKVAEILADVLRVEAARQGQTEANRVARILKAARFERRQARQGNGRVWVYQRTDSIVPGVSPEVGEVPYA